LVRFTFALLLAVGALSCARSQEERESGEAPAGSGPVARLDPRTLPALRDSFNAAADLPRIIVMLSPT